MTIATRFTYASNGARTHSGQTPNDLETARPGKPSELVISLNRILLHQILFYHLFFFFFFFFFLIH